jgi:hypothetical protein
MATVARTSKPIDLPARFRSAPRAERQGLVALVGLTEEDAASPLRGVPGQLGDQAALADPGLAPHEEELRMAASS